MRALEVIKKWNAFYANVFNNEYFGRGLWAAETNSNNNNWMWWVKWCNVKLMGCRLSIRRWYKDMMSVSWTTDKLSEHFLIKILKLNW